MQYDFLGDIERKSPTKESNDFLSDIESKSKDFLSDIEKTTPTEKNIYDIPNLSPDQIRNMPVHARMEFLENLKRGREISGGKGLLSGLTMGASELIPGLEVPKEDLSATMGEFLGSAAPVGAIFKLIGAPVVKLASKSPIAKKGIESLARMTGFGLTGAAYETGKETIKEGELPTAQEVAKYGAEWALFDGALQIVGKGASTFIKKLASLSEKTGISEKEILNNVLDTLKEKKISLEKDPEKAIKTAQEILNSFSKEIKSTPEAILVEATGKGAGERIEYPKEGTEKFIETMNSFIEEAKTPVESTKRRIESANTAIFNALAPLEKLETEIPISQRASTKIKMAQSVASEIGSVLENGIFSNVTGNFEHGGLKEAYGDVIWKKATKDLKPGEYSLQEIDTYRTAKSALKRQSEGKKTGIDTEKAREEVRNLAEKYEPIDRKIREFQKATLSTYGKDLLGEELIERWNKDYYSPLFRVMEEGKDSILSAGSLIPKQPFKKMKGSQRKIIPPSESDIYNTSMLVRNARKNDAVLQYKDQILKGNLPGRVKQAKTSSIPENIVKELEVPKELEPVAESLYNQTRKDAFTPEKNILRAWENGKPFEIEVPEEVYDVFSSMAPQDRNSVAKVFGAVNRLFSRGISMEPRKFLSILSRDALSSLIYSRTGSNPVSIFQALSDIYHARPVYKEFLSMGGDIYASRLAERIDRAHKIDDLITPGKKGILVPFEKASNFFKKYPKVLSEMSMAVPLAEYKRAIAKYGNTAEGRIMAAMEARRVTYDPTRKGSSKLVKELGNYIPFWNVSLQDLSMVGQNLKRPETWMKGTTAITMPTILLKMANEGNPDYEALTPVDKAAFWHIFSGDNHIRIPIPWLLGTAFKVSAEAFYDTTVDMLNTGDGRAKEAWEGLYHNFAEQVSGSVPPFLQIYTEQTLGKTLPSPLGSLLGTQSRAPEIVPKRLQGLEPRLQYTSKTSQIARKWGDLWNVSPVKVERFIRGLGGTSAQTILALTDEIAYQTGLAEDTRPEEKEKNYLLLGHFVSDSTPSNTKYQKKFYEYLDKSQRFKKSSKILSKEQLQKSEDKKFANVNLSKYQNRITKLFREMRAIEENKNLSPSVKKSHQLALKKEINNLYMQGTKETEKIIR